MRRFSDSNFIGKEAEGHPIISRSRIILSMLFQLSLWTGVLSTHCLTHRIKIQNLGHIFSLYLVMCTRAMDTYWLQPGLSIQSLLAESIWGLFIICLTLFPHYMNKNVLMSQWEWEEAVGETSLGDRTSRFQWFRIFPKVLPSARMW